MNVLRTAFVLSTLALSVSVWAPESHAFTYAMPSDTSLYRQSEGVVVARVVEELDPAFDSRLPQRRWKIEIERVLAGLPRQGEAVLRLPGTPDQSSIRLFLPGVPALTSGERVLVFYVGGADDELRPVQLSLGLFFETALSDARRGYVRALDGTESVTTKSLDAAYGLPRDADRFESWIATGARGTAFGYLSLNEGKAASREAKFNLVRDAAGVPIRWFTFDTGGSVQWSAMTGAPAGSSFNPDTAIPAALGAWSNDASSRINLTYNSNRVASDPGNDISNGINAVVWDDPGNDIPGAFNCAGSDGVLGVGGQFFGSPVRLFDGAGYHEAVEGFLITQDAAGCFLSGTNGQIRAAEVLTHEFGHTLGFAHSCGDLGQPSCALNPVLDDATMRGRIHDDFRAASIRSDDIKAAYKVYPSPTYEHPQERMVDSVTSALTGCTGSGSRDASSNADGSVIVFQTSCTGGTAKLAGHPAIMVMDRAKCAQQLNAKADDARCSEKRWMRYTKAEPIDTGIEPSISADGRYVVFASDQPIVAKNLMPPAIKASFEKGSGWAVYMRNLLTGATFSMAPGTTAGAGTQPQVSPDGSSITFVSTGLPENGAGELPDATPDVFQLKPVFGGNGDPIGIGPVVCASCKDAQNQPAANPAANSSGGTVAYALGSSVWLRNMLTGATNQMVPPAGSGVVPAPSMNYSGGTVVINTAAALDDDGSDTNGKEDVYTYDTCCNKFTRVSKPDAELPNPVVDQMPSGQAVISGDGRRVAFVSRAQNLMGYTPEANGFDNVYAYDVRERIKRRYSRTSAGTQSNGDSARPYLNYNGNMMLFDSAATNFDGADANGVQDVYQRPNPLAEFVVFGADFE